MSFPQTLHAGLVARRLNGVWRGVLIEGRSGAGKSDLALRAMNRGWRLVADDRVVLWTSGGHAYGRPPAPLAGLLEARGVGLAAAEGLQLSRIDLVVAHADAPERMPEAAFRRFGGVEVPLVELNLTEKSTVFKLLPALSTALQGDALSQLGARAW